MPLVIPSGYGKATLIWDHTGDPLPYTIDFGYVDDGTKTAIQQATDISNAWVTNYSAAANMTVGYTFRGVHTVLNRSGVLHEGDYLPNVVGTYNVSPPPQNVALLVQKLTGLAGRKYRGRAYLPPCYIDRAGVSDIGVVLAATRTTLNGRLALFLAALLTASNQMFILHSDGVTIPTQVTALNLETVVATQRRRLR
jgi:hypothetical protein